jgi:hypothetical protein
MTTKTFADHSAGCGRRDFSLVLASGVWAQSLQEAA